MRIACIHQGYELYGSDRSFVESVKAIRAAYPSAEIEVVLPRDGPIVAPLQPYADRIAYEPLWVLRRRGLARLATLGMLRLPAALLRAARRFGRCDLVYINTSVVADYMLAARLFPGKALLHIHEMPEGFTRAVLRAMARWSGAEIIFNSKASRAAFALSSRHSSHIVYNGIAGPEHPAPATYDGRRKLRVLILGRISPIKGQEVLIEAMTLAPELRGRLEVRMVGGAFEDPGKEEALAALVRGSGLDGVVSLLPFTEAPEEHFLWADTVLVPSRRPESLGRVAIEAMAFGRPPVVSDIGGLREIVDHGRTGWLVPPGRPEELAGRLLAIVKDPASLATKVGPARQRYEALFSEAAVAAEIVAVVSGMVGPPPRPAPRQPVAVALDRP